MNVAEFNMAFLYYSDFLSIQIKQDSRPLPMLTPAPPLLSCPKCLKQYKYRESLFNHLRNDCGIEQPLKCPNCEFLCNRKSDLQAHVKQFHWQPKPQKPNFGTHMCSKCNRTYLHKKHLMRHMTYECGVEPQFQCPYCPQRFKRDSHRKKHVLDFLMALEWEGNDEIVSCPKCSKQYKYRESLRNHLRNDCGIERRFKCYLCDYSCKRSKDLKTHVIHRHLKPKDILGTHRCIKCGRTYQHKKHLVRHMNFECGVEPRFQCPYCPLKFKRNAHLARHMKGQHTLAFITQRQSEIINSSPANITERTNSTETLNMNRSEINPPSNPEMNLITKTRNEFHNLVTNPMNELNIISKSLNLVTNPMNEINLSNIQNNQESETNAQNTNQIESSDLSLIAAKIVENEIKIKSEKIDVQVKKEKIDHEEDKNIKDNEASPK